MDRLTIGTRGSALALAQTKAVAEALKLRHPHLGIQVAIISTAGDRIQDRPISAVGDKGVFVRALETALVAGEIDIAVHSLKDVPADAEVAGLTFAAFPPRATPWDALVSHGSALADLPAGARIGTSSTRRRVQIRSLYPHLQFLDIRGNVDTRLAKLERGEYDALILAAAGLARLGLENRVTQLLSLEECVPDAGQGTVAVQTRADGPVPELAVAINDPTSRVVALTERSVVRALGAGCHSPVGAYAAVTGARICLTCAASREDGSGLTRWYAEGEVGMAEALGQQVGESLAQRLSLDGPPYTEV